MVLRNKLSFVKKPKTDLVLEYFFSSKFGPLSDRKKTSDVRQIPLKIFIRYEKYRNFGPGEDKNKQLYAQINCFNLTNHEIPQIAFQLYGFWRV